MLTQQSVIQNVTYNSLWYSKNTRESWLPRLFVTSIRTGLQKQCLVPKTAGNQDSSVYSLWGNLVSLEYSAPASVFLTYFGRLHCVFITGESPLRGDEYIRESRNPSQACLLWPGEIVRWKKRSRKKSHNTVPLSYEPGGRYWRRKPKIKKI